MSFIATRKAKSDYIDSDVKNCSKRMTHIRYIGGNNLYGSQVIFNLPTHDYRLEGKSFIKKIERKPKNHVPIDMNERGMFLEVDLEYPEGIHNQHEDFPMAPERYIVKYNELSPLNQYLYRKMKTSDFSQIMQKKN